MCLRWWHQSVVKNGTLYIDGGDETFRNHPDSTATINNPTTSGYNNQLIMIDLTVPWNSGTNLTQTAINKTANVNTGTFVPSYVRGSLFQGSPEDPKMYMYGGTTDYWNTSFPNWTW